MGRTRLLVRLRYPPTGSQEPCLFNDESCTLRYGHLDLAIALRARNIFPSTTVYHDGSAKCEFRITRRFFEPLKEVLVAPYVRPEPPPPTGCTKIAYTGQDAALRAAARTISSPWYENPSNDPLVPYVCGECGSWHIGHRYRQTIRKFLADAPLPS